MFDVRQVFLETGVNGASSFADVEFGATNDVHTVVRQAIELFGDVHLRCRPLDVRAAVHMNGHILHLGELHGGFLVVWWRAVVVWIVPACHGCWYHVCMRAVVVDRRFEQLDRRILRTR